jgi:hypothetical protein
VGETFHICTFDLQKAPAPSSVLVCVFFAYTVYQSGLVQIVTLLLTLLQSTQGWCLGVYCTLEHLCMKIKIKLYEVMILFVLDVMTYHSAIVPICIPTHSSTWQWPSNSDTISASFHEYPHCMDAWLQACPSTVSKQGGGDCSRSNTRSKAAA